MTRQPSINDHLKHPHSATTPKSRPQALNPWPSPKPPTSSMEWREASLASSLASFASSLASSLASVASSASTFLNYPSATPTIKKEKNLDPYNKTNESVFQSTRRIDLVLRNYHQGHAEIEDANGSHGPFNESCSDRDLKRAFRLATMWRGHN